MWLISAVTKATNSTRMTKKTKRRWFTCVRCSGMSKLKSQPYTRTHTAAREDVLHTLARTTCPCSVHRCLWFFCSAHSLWYGVSGRIAYNLQEKRRNDIDRLDANKPLTRMPRLFAAMRPNGEQMKENRDASDVIWLYVRECAQAARILQRWPIHLSAFTPN